MVAAHSGHADLVGFLLERGADANSDDAGYTALQAAVLRGDIPMIRALLDQGADPNTRLEKGTQVRRASQDWQLRPRYVTATPFWLAAQFREAEIMRILVAGGADPVLTTLERLQPVKERAGGVAPPPPVWWAGSSRLSWRRSAGGVTEVDSSWVANMTTREAEEAMALEAARVAVDLGTDVNAVDESGTTALHSAASINFTSIVRFLAERGANLSVENKAGETPLSIAEAAEERRARREDTVEQGPSTADVLRELGATE